MFCVFIGINLGYIYKILNIETRFDMYCLWFQYAFMLSFEIFKIGDNQKFYYGNISLEIQEETNEVKWVELKSWQL